MKAPPGSPRRAGLFPLREDLRFSGRVHETVLPAAQAAGLPVVEEGPPVHHYGYVRSPAVNAERQKRYLRLAERNSSMHGFTVFHYQDEYAAMGAELAGWAAEGKLSLHEHIEEGIDRFPEALMMLNSGGHRGKLLVAV